MKGLKGWGLRALTLFGGLLFLTAMMPKLVGFSAATEHETSPFQEHRFKITSTLFRDMEETLTTDDVASAADRSPKPALKPTVLFHSIIKRAAAQYQIDPDLVRAIIFAESGYDPMAMSKKGAMGLMQLMPKTAEAMGVEDCFDPEHNIFGGVKYFKNLFVQFDGDVELALAAYNAGSRRVREFNGVPPFKATEQYIQKVMKRYNKYKGRQTEPMDLR